MATAPATTPVSSLTGTTLPSTITTSSLTSVGTLTQLQVTGNVTAASINGITGIATTNPAALGAPTAGTSKFAARADHVHPLPTISAASLTGTALPAAIVASSLTSVGTLAQLRVAGNITAASVNGITGIATAIPVALGNAAIGTSTFAARADHVHPLPTTVTGNAATATKLQTPRMINGVNFDGTINISVPAAAATLTGNVLNANVKASSLTSVGTLTSLAVAGDITVNGRSVGFLAVPQKTVTTVSYNVVLADAGTQLYTAVGGVAWTIPANTAVPFPVGTALTFVNNSQVPCGITIATDTLRQVISGAVGIRTLGAYGIATAVKVAPTVWMISGANLT